ncbi:hypothetical protein GcC1_194001 [Golovinomyces cichoracearum]|uniref:Uncharacterized protein n=1 Tax=Golovinomyces cichoracearum TaxID=62708 RepID=A0A420HHB9_9PEZI|nr:hypothetical protein GcC1_194001 [Golovinomyces cichoracearum]
MMALIEVGVFHAQTGYISQILLDKVLEMLTTCIKYATKATLIIANVECDFVEFLQNISSTHVVKNY